VGSSPRLASSPLADPFAAKCDIRDCLNFGVQSTGKCDDDPAPKTSNGCSIPSFLLPVLNGLLPFPEKSRCYEPSNPACGRFTHFGNARNGPCDVHDFCYGTCSGVDPTALSDADGSRATYESHKAMCDNRLAIDSFNVCDAAERQGEDPEIVANCRRIAPFMGIGTGLFGDNLLSGHAFGTAQQSVCKCCPKFVPK